MTSMKRKEKENLIQWHPGFVGAVHKELKEQGEGLVLEREHNLNVKPLVIDMLIIKKDRETKITNEIGHFFREHNIVEFKSPKAALNIDVVYKVVGYAALYKAYGESVDCIKASDITITVIRWAKPVGLFRYFKNYCIPITEHCPGVYYVEWNGGFPLQVIVTKELDKERHVWLRSLSDELDEEDLSRLFRSVGQTEGKQEREYAEAVMQVGIKANVETIKKMKKEEENMSCQALLELFEPELKQAVEEGEHRGERKERKNGIRVLVETLSELGYSEEDIVNVLMQKYHMEQTSARRYMNGHL